MNKTILLFFLVFLTETVLATVQRKDSVIYNGYSYHVDYDLMYDYFAINPQKQPNLECSSTALSRGYIATFKIIKNEILLKNITILVKKQGYEDCTETTWKSIINEVFPGQEKVKVIWYTGLLVLPYHFISRTDAMYSSIYERYTIFEIEKGDIIKERALNTEQFTIFKEKLYQCFKETEEYSKLVKELSNKWNPRLLDSWLKEYAVGYMKKIIE